MGIHKLSLGYLPRAALGCSGVEHLRSGSSPNVVRFRPPASRAVADPPWSCCGGVLDQLACVLIPTSLHGFFAHGAPVHANTHHVFGMAHRPNCYGANEGKVRCLRVPAPYFDRRAPIPGNKRSGQAFLRRPVDIPAPYLRAGGHPARHRLYFLEAPDRRSRPLPSVGKAPERPLHKRSNRRRAARWWLGPEITGH